MVPMESKIIYFIQHAIATQSLLKQYKSNDSKTV